MSLHDAETSYDRMKNLEKSYENWWITFDQVDSNVLWNEVARSGPTGNGAMSAAVLAVTVAPRPNKTGSTSNGANGQDKVMECYMCEEEGQEECLPSSCSIEASKQMLRDGGGSTPVSVDSVTVGATPINYAALRNREEYEHYL
jgi:hypothetical protein